MHNGVSQESVQKAFHDANKGYEEYQTRTHDGELKFFPKLSEAFEYAWANPEVWKISWTRTNGQRARFVKQAESGMWKDDPI